MFSITEQLSQASKAFFEAQMVSAAAFAQAAFDSGVSAIDVNVDAFKSSMAAATVATRQWMSVRDAQEWLSLTRNQSQLAMQGATAYGRQAADAAKGSRARFSRVAETAGAASKKKGADLVDVVKNSPAASITPLNSFLKSAFDNAQAGYDQFTRAGQVASMATAQSGKQAHEVEY